MNISLLQDPRLEDNKIYIATPTPGDYYLRGPYGIKGDTARWAVLTDGIGLDHQMHCYVNVKSKREGHWSLSNNIKSATIDVAAINGGSVYSLTLNTTNSRYYGCDETDLLLMAITPIPGLVREPGIVPMDEQPSLAEMDTLTASWEEGLIQFTQGQRCQAGYDMSIVMFSIYLKDTVSDQTFQYEVVTYDSRDMRFNASVYANTGAFVGIADSCDYYAFPYLVPDRPRVITIDVLPRLRQLIQASQSRSLVAWSPSYKSPGATRSLVAPPILNPDLTRWKVLMASWGPFNNGSARIVSTLEGIELSYTYLSHDTLVSVIL